MPKRYRRLAPRLNADLVQITLRTARKVVSVQDCCDLLLISRPTFYQYESKVRAPYGKMRPHFLHLCKKLKLRKLTIKWSQTKGYGS